jgi:CubicO group peptidase (beta-lactamase class C family)
MKIFIFCFCFLFAEIIHGQTLYYPPVIGNTWESQSPESLGWCTNQIDMLYKFLEQNNSKGFMVLKDGKIIIEKYFGTFTKDSLWYWASAGKSLTSFLIGKAQEEKYLSIYDKSNLYLGKCWTKCSEVQEDAITIRHQLSMTTGLDDYVKDNHCTLDSCLIYKAAAGSRWAYHNAPYTLLEKVISVATKQNINAYTKSRLSDKTGVSGFWYTTDYDNVFYSKMRSLARYGLLAQHDFVWDSDTLLKDSAYIRAMINSSQQINPSYGYLWWLNGKQSYMVPTLQTQINGSYAPNAPKDMFAAIGKNGQIISVSKSTGLVLIRIGNAPSEKGEVPTKFCDNLWEAFNKVTCSNTTDIAEIPSDAMHIYPNPSLGMIQIRTSNNLSNYKLSLFTTTGKCIFEGENTQQIDSQSFPKGIYLIRMQQDNKQFTQKIVIE